MLTGKKKKNAQNAEKNIPKPKPSEVVSEEQTEEDTPKLVLFDLSKFSKEKIEQAEALGIPIREIAETMNTYAQTIEDRFEIVAKAIPTKKDIQGAMTQAISNAQKKQREAYAKAVQEGKVPPQGQGGGGMGLLDVLKMAGMGGGGGGDEELRKLQLEMYRANIDSIKKRADLSDQVVTAVISKIVSKGVKEIVP